jgi:4-hydroxy-tetrahydrodipicolinate synthase
MPSAHAAPRSPTLQPKSKPPRPQPLTGTHTALVTPFNNDGSLDLGALDALVQWQLDSGVQGLVPCGTTGEACTLTPRERVAIIGTVAKRAHGRAWVMAGTGSQGLVETLDFSRQARDAGATVALVVTPFYNRPTPEGLYRYYSSLCEADVLPQVLYNVPSRTACDMLPPLLGRLAAYPQIWGIKEATGDLDRVSALASLAPHWSLLSGDDATTCAFTLMGGHGVVSVVSNVAPAWVSQMVQFARDGNVTQARELHTALRELCRALFNESNPIPVKAALAWQNRLKEVYRLPLCEMSAHPKEQLLTALRALPKLR